LKCTYRKAGHTEENCWTKNAFDLLTEYVEPNYQGPPDNVLNRACMQCPSFSDSTRILPCLYIAGAWILAVSQERGGWGPEAMAAKGSLPIAQYQVGAFRHPKLYCAILKITNWKQPTRRFPLDAKF
jgi:hypothetical protein